MQSNPRYVQLVLAVVLALAGLVVLAPPTRADGPAMATSQSGTLVATFRGLHGAVGFSDNIYVMEGTTRVDICTSCNGASSFSISLGNVSAATTLVVGMYVTNTGSTYLSSDPAGAIPGPGISVAASGTDDWVIELEDLGDSLRPDFEVTLAVSPMTASEVASTNNMFGKSINCSTPKPVNCASGNFWHTFTDLVIPGRGPAIDLERTYSASNAATDGPFGFGWTDSYAMSLSVDTTTGAATIDEGNGSTVTFLTAANGAGYTGVGYVAPTWVEASLAKRSDGTWSLTDSHTGWVRNFDTSGHLTTIVDRNGTTTTLTYAGSGPSAQLQSVTDTAGRVLTFTYNSAGRISQVSDPANRTDTYLYDAAGNLTDATDPAGSHWKFAYDAQHRLTTMTDPNGGSTVNTYDSQGRVTAQQDPMNRTTTIAYAGDPGSSNGSTTTITDPRGFVRVETYQNWAATSITTGYGTPAAATTTLTYDPISLGVATRTDPNGHTTTYTWDQSGNLLKTKDALGRTTTTSWNSFNLPATSTDAVGTTTTYAYDGYGNLTQVSRPLGGGAQIQTTNITHANTSHRGDITSITDPDGHTTSLTYDGAGNLTSSTDATGNTTTFSYNTLGAMLGLPTSRVTPRGNVAGGSAAGFTWTYAYDNLGRLTSATDPLGHAEHAAYDANGDLITATDANGNVTHNHFNADGEQTSSGRAGGTTIASTYDADGQLTSRTDGGGNTTTYTHGDAALPQAVTASTDPLSRVTSFAYDGAGNLTSKQSPTGTCTGTSPTGCTTYGYDAANELTSIGYSDASTHGVTYTYTLDGQRATMVDGTGTTTYTYDSLDRLTDVTNGNNAHIGYGYDLASNRTSITYPDGHVVSRAYDNANRLTGISDWLGHTTTIAPDPDGNQAAITYGNGDTATNAFNAADQLTSVNLGDPNATGGNPTTLGTLGYTRDSAGQLTSDTPSGSTGIAGPQQSFDYTPLNQLASVTTGTGGSATTRNYSYDASDNLTGLASGAAQSFDAADQLQSQTTTSNGISYVGSTSSGTFATQTTTTVALPAGTTTGDQIIVAVSLPATQTPTTPTGYTQVGNYQAGSDSGAERIVLYRRTATSSDISGTLVTITVPGGFYTYTVLLAVYRGVDPASPIDTTSSGTTSLGSTVTAPSVTTQVPSERLLMINGENNSVVAPSGWSLPTGLTERTVYGGGSTSADLADQGLTTSGSTGTKTSTLLNAQGSLVAALIALRPAGSIYTYNSRGDRITWTSNVAGVLSTTSYTYDLADRLVATSDNSTSPATTTSSTYDGDGLRATQTNAHGTLVHETWDQSSVPALLQDGSIDYLYDDLGNPIEQVTAAGVPTYYMHDQYGSTRVLTGQGGTITGTFSYDPYGSVTSQTGTTDTPLRWNGQYQDQDTHLYYMRARTYDPATGQFLTVDPEVGSTGAPYRFAANNPTNEADPSGLDTLGYCGSFAGGTTEGGTAEACLTRVLGTSQIGIVGTAGIVQQIGVDASFSATIQYSNANSLSQLSGPFTTVGVSADWAVGGTFNIFYGNDSNGNLIYGFTAGPSLGGGAGGDDGTVGGSNTLVHQFNHWWDKYPAIAEWNTLGLMTYTSGLGDTLQQVASYLADQGILPCGP